MYYDARQGYARVANCLSSIIVDHGDKTLMEIKLDSPTEAITHQSTWCLVTYDMLNGKGKEIITQLKELKGSLIMKLLLRMFGNDELEMKVFDTVTVTQFLQHLETFAG